MPRQQEGIERRIGRRMNSGKLRHRLTIQTKTQTGDGYGEGSAALATLATVWGSIEPVRGTEFLNAQQVNAEVSHQIVLRYRSDLTVTPENQISYSGRTFEIQSIRNMGERDRTWEIDAKEVVV